VWRDSDQLKYAFTLALLHFAMNLCRCLFRDFITELIKLK